VGRTISWGCQFSNVPGTCNTADIAYAVAVVLWFSANPGSIHWEAVKRVFKYLKGTIDLWLTYGTYEEGDKLLGYTNGYGSGHSDESLVVAEDKALRYSSWTVRDLRGSLGVSKSAHWCFITYAFCFRRYCSCSPAIRGFWATEARVSFLVFHIWKLSICRGASNFRPCDKSIENIFRFGLPSSFVYTTLQKPLYYSWYYSWYSSVFRVGWRLSVYFIPKFILKLS